MFNTNFYEITENAMNTAAETSRDKGLLENALTMTAFSMPSQADVIDYEITLLTEKQNQIHQHIEELLSEAIERHAELNAERADILSEVNHYEAEYKAAHDAKINARRFHGGQSIQFEKQQSRFHFACEMHTKAQKQLTGNEYELSEMSSLIANVRDWLTGNAPSVVAVKADDMPFESATVITAERFQQILESVDVVPAVEQYLGRDIDSILSEVSDGYNATKIMVCSAIGSEIWEHEDLTDVEKEAFEQALATQFETVAEHLEEVNAVSQLPSQRRINANIGIRA